MGVVPNAMTQRTTEQPLSNDRPKRILLVEDDVRIVNFMQRGLEAEGITLDVASAKVLALRLAESHCYDTIIFDIFLGDDNGLDICRTLRQHAVTTPILVMTAKDSRELREASVRAGANAFLTKPFSFEDLLSTLEKMCQVCSKIENAQANGVADARSHLNHEPPGFQKPRKLRWPVWSSFIPKQNISSTAEADVEQTEWEWQIAGGQNGHSERAALLRPVLYEMTASMGVPTQSSHRGKVLSLNISSGGMLVLMDQSPTVGQVLKVHIPTPILQTETPTLAEVRWTRRLPFDKPEGNEAYLVGLKFMFC